MPNKDGTGPTGQGKGRGQGGQCNRNRQGQGRAAEREFRESLHHFWGVRTRPLNWSAMAS